MIIIFKKTCLFIVIYRIIKMILDKSGGKYELINEKIDLHKEQKLAIISVFPLVLLFMAFSLDTPQNIINGMYKMVLSPTILVTDFIELSGIGATFVNAAIISIFNIYLIHKMKFRVNGTLIAAIFMIMGFSFFGKNILNIWPIYLGGLIYSRYKKEPYKNIILIIMFGTSLSPIVSELAFGIGLPIHISLPFGIIVGTFIGFILPPLSGHVLSFHAGYNIYNIGFAAGVIGSVITSVLRSYGIDISPQSIIYSGYDMHMKVILICLFSYLIAIGYYINGKSFRGYTKIFSYTGRLITDFTQLLGYGITFINMGIMGFLALAYVILLKGVINGPIIAGILAMVGFGAFGKHPKNVWPILLGVFTGSVLKIWDVNSTVVIISGLFGTALAPIAGRYGSVAGFIAGFIHLSVVMNIGVLHGGINLYNNGFSAGMVAGFLVPIIDAFKKGEDKSWDNMR